MTLSSGTGPRAQRRMRRRLALTSSCCLLSLFAVPASSLPASVRASHTLFLRPRTSARSHPAPRRVGAMPTPIPAVASAKRFAPAAERNTAPILDVLRQVLPVDARVLAVAEGSGQHVTAFAKHFTAAQFQPTEMEPDCLASIAAYVSDAGGVHRFLLLSCLCIHATPGRVSSAGCVFTLRQLITRKWPRAHQRSAAGCLRLHPTTRARARGRNVRLCVRDQPHTHCSLGRFVGAARHRRWACSTYCSAGEF